MTGYGKAEALLETGKITVEIRSLNGKTADIGIKTSMLPKDKEIAVRQKIAAELTRGNIEVLMLISAVFPLSERTSTVIFPVSSKASALPYPVIDLTILYDFLICSRKSTEKSVYSQDYLQIHYYQRYGRGKQGSN